MLEERRLRGDGIVTYVVSKTLGDVARERARAVVASTLLLLLGWHVVDLKRILLSSTLCLAALVAHLVTQTQLSESITLIKQLGVQVRTEETPPTLCPQIVLCEVVQGFSKNTRDPFSPFDAPRLSRKRYLFPQGPSSRSQWWFC